MKKIIFASSLALMYACKTPVIIRASEKEASITVDGKEMGNGETSIIKIKKKNSISVEVKNTGYLTDHRVINYQGLKFKPVVEYIELAKDDAWEASIQNDYANKDFEVTVKKEMNEEQAWKLISQIVTGYFDILEMADKSTGYMKTSWQSKVFSQKIVRSRVIVKQSSTNPLRYKLKIVSEYSEDPNTSVKNDEKFREWDRILRAYNDLLTEFQSRLGE